MSIKRKIYWYVHSEPPVKGNMENPSWSDVEQILASLGESGGVVFDSTGYAGFDEKCLQLSLEDSKHFMTLSESTGDTSVLRCYWVDSASFEMLEINGNFWDSRMVCHDFATVLSVFRDYSETGDVPRSLFP